MLANYGKVSAPSNSGVDVPAPLAMPAALLEVSVTLQDASDILPANAPLDMHAAQLPRPQPPLDGPQPRPVWVRARPGYLRDFVSSFHT